MNKEEAKKIFGKNLKELRLSKGMSQEELAHALGFKNRSSINKIELGKNDMPRALVPYAPPDKTLKAQGFERFIFSPW